MSDPIYIRWLDVDDAAAVAELERDFHPEGFRAGLEELAKDISSAEDNLCNLWLGLFDGDRMVGYLLASLEPDRHDVFEYFEVPVPEGAPPGMCAFVADTGVRDAYKRHLPLLFRRLIMVLLETHGGPTIEAFSTGPLRDHWSAKAGALRRLGYSLDRVARVQDSPLGFEQHWLTFVPYEKPVRRRTRSVSAMLEDSRTVEVEAVPYRVGVMRSAAAFRALVEDWQGLLGAASDRSLFHHPEYLYAWWLHLGTSSKLHLIVAYQGERIVGIAPMHLVWRRRLSRWLHYLEFLGHAGHPEAPAVLAAEGDAGVHTAVARYVTADEEWDVLHARQQRKRDATGRALARAATEAGRAVRRVSGEGLASLRLDGTWAAFLEGHPAGPRLQSAREALSAAGQLDISDPHEPPVAEAALRRFAELELRAERQQVAPHTSSYDFYRRILQLFGGAGQARFRTLSLDGENIAASLGLVHGDAYHTLCTIHDRSHAGSASELILAAAELAWAFEQPGLCTFTFAPGSRGVTSALSAEVSPTESLFAYGRRAPARLFYLASLLRPRVDGPAREAKTL